MYITPSELLARYAAGERNFAGVGIWYDYRFSFAFKRANLSNIIWSGAELPQLRLREVNLSGAKLIGAYLAGADLGLADLSKADLTGAT
ncbi:MAG: pentapeptide repeat-containing protein [Scytonema sp. CRU_2_7]|nr:pentapeptide repeat-containing protein [Scytonema sp. CRU_2_7]